MHFDNRLLGPQWNASLKRIVDQARSSGAFKISGMAQSGFQFESK